MEKRNKIIYYAATGLLTVLIVMSVGSYIFDHETIAGVFIQMKYPAYLVYPLAFAKILGLIAIWTKKSAMLKEWAYAGFFFNFSLAFGAHVGVDDGQFPGAIIATVLLAVSYIYDKKVYGMNSPSQGYGEYDSERQQ